MAFCRKCGTDLKEANFCPSCGTPSGEDSVVNERHSSDRDIRSQSLSEMSDMLKYFGVKKDVYNKQHSLGLEIEKREEKGYLGWLIPAAIFGLMGFLLYKVGNTGFLQVVVEFFPSFIFIAIFILLKRNNSKKLRVAWSKYETVSAELEEYHAAYGYCPLGVEYTDPDILVQINHVIREGRATTPESALNILLEDVKNAELMDRMNAQLKATEEVKKEVERTGKAAKKAANYASANFWFKN